MSPSRNDIEITYKQRTHTYGMRQRDSQNTSQFNIFALNKYKYIYTFNIFHFVGDDTIVQQVVQVAERNKDPDYLLGSTGK